MCGLGDARSQTRTRWSCFAKTGLALTAAIVLLCLSINAAVACSCDDELEDYQSRIESINLRLETYAVTHSISVTDEDCRAVHRLLTDINSAIEAEDEFHTCVNACPTLGLTPRPDGTKSLSSLRDEIYSRYSVHPPCVSTFQIPY